MQELIGQEGSSAERVRNFRARQKQKALQCNTDVTKCNTESELEIESEKELEQDDGLIDINNYLNNMEFVQNRTHEYNDIFRAKKLYFENPDVLPESVANQIKLYQVAVKRLYDNKQCELLENVNIKLLEKVFENITKIQNITNIEEYYITSLCNEIAKGG